MSRRSRHALALGVAAALLCAGCLFHDAPPPRYFAPPLGLSSGEDPPAAAAPATVSIRLRGVRAAGYLGEQIAWRVSDVERGLYEQRRWTEFPSRYVDRAMKQALDRIPGMRRVESGHVPTLDLELVAFDDVLAPTHEAAVEIIAALRDAEQAAIFERSFVARRAVADADPGSVARAMGAALDEVVTEIATQVAGDLPRPAAAARR